MSKENEEINEAMIVALKEQVKLLEDIIKLKDDALESKEKIIKVKDEQIALYKEGFDKQVNSTTIKLITSKLIMSDTYNNFYDSIKELIKDGLKEDAVISSLKITFSFISVGADLDGTLNEVWNNRQSIINTINLI